MRSSTHGIVRRGAGTGNESPRRPGTSRVQTPARGDLAPAAVDAGKNNDRRCRQRRRHPDDDRDAVDDPRLLLARKEQRGGGNPGDDHAEIGKLMPEDWSALVAIADVENKLEETSDRHEHQTGDDKWVSWKPVHPSYTIGHSAPCRNVGCGSYRAGEPGRACLGTTTSAAVGKPASSSLVAL